MTPINFAKGCHPFPSVLDDVLFVTVILLLVSPSRFPFKWRFCPAPGIAAVTPWQPSLRASPFRMRVTNEKLLYRTIKYDKMGWICLGTLWTDELYWSMSQLLLTLPMLRQHAHYPTVTLRRRNLGGGTTIVVPEMDICAMPEQ